MKLETYGTGVQAGFAIFWAAYPRKVAKQAAWKAWARLHPTEDLLTVMLAKLREQAVSVQWQKDGGQFIPHPSTWLNQGRWEDEGIETVGYYQPPWVCKHTPPCPHRVACSIVAGRSERR